MSVFVSDVMLHKEDSAKKLRVYLKLDFGSDGVHHYRARKREGNSICGR